MKRALLLFAVLWASLSPAQTVLQHFIAVSKGGIDVSDMDIGTTSEGSVIIAMPLQLSPGVKVLSVTDNAPTGSNIYKQIPASTASCDKLDMEIWYCEKCAAGVTELKFHLSGPPRASLNALVEVSGLALPAVLDGQGTHLEDGTRTSKGEEVGPVIKTTMADFIIARYHSDFPIPKAVTPDPWQYRTSYVYIPNAPAGSYQPTLSGGEGKSGKYCMSAAAFKVAPPAPSAPATSAPQAPPSNPAPTPQN